MSIIDHAKIEFSLLWLCLCWPCQVGYTETKTCLATRELCSWCLKTWTESVALRRRKDTRSCLDILSCRVDYCNSTLYVQLTSVRSSQCWMGQRDSSQESASTTTSQTPCVTTFIGCRCDNAFSTSWARWCSVVRSRHVHFCVVTVVCNWSSTSPFCRPSRSDNSMQSIGAIWITQLRHFRPFNLELVATDCSRHEPYIHWFLQQT